MAVKWVVSLVDWKAAWMVEMKAADWVDKMVVRMVWQWVELKVGWKADWRVAKKAD
jgi:hypothetical protein